MAFKNGKHPQGLNLCSLRLKIGYAALSIHHCMKTKFNFYIVSQQDQGIRRLKQELKSYTVKRKEEVSSHRVELLMRDIMFSHLNLLVIFGCTVGIFLGILSRITGVGQVI